MKIIKFVAKNLHGYMNFEINFNKDLTFLTGINGSGKTSIVKGVSSLILPSIINLAHVDYELIKVELNCNGKNVKISSIKKKDKIIFSCSGISKTKNNEVEINIFPTGDFPESYRYRYREKEEDFYRNEMIKKSDNPILEYIERLPTPLILGIERRGSEFFQIREKAPLYIDRRYRGFLESNVQLGISEAVRLAEEKFRKIQAKLEDITENLKKHLISKSFEYSEKEKKIDIKKLKSVAKSIDLDKVVSVIVKMGFDEEEIRKKLLIFFKKLVKIANYLPESTDFKKIVDAKDDKLFDSFIEYILNEPQFYRIIDIVDYIDDYSKDYEKINEPITRYIEIVNRFFKDSNKEILFNETGSLMVKMKNGKICSPDSLSSGEIQIIIIMTHLAFNEFIQEANIFIIDEPELSLHIRWQEIFVETIRKLNPALQLIIATHSPSILLNDTDHCISLNKGVKND